MIWEALAAGIVGALLLWIVLQPLLLPAAIEAPIFEPPDPEETPQGQALMALREIDFDRATGKLSDTDYQDLHARYSALAIAALERAEPASPDDPLEVMIARRAARPTAGSGTGARCAIHGMGGEAEARFCAECGAGLLTDTECCVGCGVAVPADALFCPGCGVRVRS